MNGEWLFHSGTLGVFVAVALVVIRFVRAVERKIARDESLKKDYPPHRHINGKLIYPKEYSPARTENLEG